MGIRIRIPDLAGRERDREGWRGRRLKMANRIARVEFLVQALFRRQDRCPYCGLGNADLAARKYWVIRVRNCRSCGLYYTDPIYRTVLSADFYNEMYRAEGSTTALPPEAELERLKSVCFRGTDKDFTDRIAVIRTIAPQGRLLEIGSSWGYFLFQARAAGVEAMGVEISDSRRRFGVERLGVAIVKRMEETGDTKFDVVYTSHVLEHFTDLSSIFRQVNAALVRGGLFVVEVPNFDFARHGREILNIIGAVHPLGFTTEFFRRALPGHGFQVRGIFGGWELMPDRPSADVHSPSFVLLAEKIRDSEGSA